MKQVQFSQYGTPDVLEVLETAIPQPQAGEMLIKIEAIGVNYSDILRRQNKYFMPTPLPYVPGAEAVGKVIALGEGVAAPYATGMTVLAILPAGGGYSAYVAAMASFCVPLPPTIDVRAATGIFVQGSTAQLLISEMAQDLPGKTVLINAAAGGVGSLLVQLAKMNGARVIAASSSETKMAFTRSLGADTAVNYTQANWSEAVKAANQGKGVHIVFEMVGGNVYNESLRALAPGGQVLVYGCASGVQGHIHPEYFVDENISQSGFNLAFFINHKFQIWQQALGTVIELMAQGKLKMETSKTFSLQDAGEAQRQMEARATQGKIVLIP